MHKPQASEGISARAVRSSVKWAAFTGVLPGVSVGSVQAKVVSPRCRRVRSMAARSSIKCTARMIVRRGVSGSSVNVKAVPVSVTVTLASAVLPAVSHAVTVSKFVPG